MTNTEQDLIEYIESHTLRLEASRRGGGIEVDASEYLDVEGARMTAYQNYLGGGMLGAIGSSWNAETRSADQDKANVLETALKKYFYGITEPEAEDWDEWSATSFEGMQSRPVSAY